MKRIVFIFLLSSAASTMAFANTPTSLCQATLADFNNTIRQGGSDPTIPAQCLVMGTTWRFCNKTIHFTAVENNPNQKPASGICTAQCSGTGYPTADGKTKAFNNYRCMWSGLVYPMLDVTPSN